ncbi:MAG TPA: hydroxysqualene dehydroxylase HpnE [Streptosporangiaceae bacterium]|nr:hydroxysqualene dehydroxylase HpnE [Streptosporangiaceae bacterium]
MSDPGAGRGVRAVIVGGGLAGITAALALREAGAEVTLFESRPRLGGATCSFQRGDLIVDNGQHVFLRCCTAYRGLLDRLGVADKTRIQDRFDVTVLAPDGRRARLRRAALPGPLHLLPALARYDLLTPADRLRAVRASLALRGVDTARDGERLGDWLAAHGQRDWARRALWELFVVAALNIGVDEAVLGPAAMVCQTALLGRHDAADIGVPDVPLGELHGEAAARLIGTVHLKSKVEAIEPRSDPDRDGPGGAGFDLIVDGSRVPADVVIVAVPHEVAADLVPERAAPGRERWRGLGSSPIVNVHAVYDRTVMDLPFAAAVDSPVQWVFDRTRVAGQGRGQYLASSVSAADEWIDTPTEKIRAAFVPALERLFPAARQARITDFFVTRERRATFRQIPGSGALRPAAATRLPGLFLAGAWTDTGWPDTMEGAVRSGLNAARLARVSAAADVDGGRIR